VAAADVQPVLDALPESTGVKASREEGNLGKGVVVAVLDTGCDADHDEFRERMITFASVVPDVASPVNLVRAIDAGTHGTHVNGIVAGKVVGIAPDVDLVSASVMESDTFRTTALRVVKALYWLVELLNEEHYKDKPVILNMSLGFDPKKLTEEEREDLESTLKAMHLLIQQLMASRRILPVVAIGNSGPDTSCAPGFFPECLAVGAVNYQSAEWPRSSGGFGPAGFEQECNPDISGYGVDVVSAVPRDYEGASRYESKSGTSMAAPYVTGIAALVAAKTGLHGTELREHLLSNALPLELSAERAGKGLAVYAL
jgi:subtilisin family serine protease